LGHLTSKNRWPYNLYCVGADVKPCSINQLLLPTCNVKSSIKLTQDERDN